MPLGVAAPWGPQLLTPRGAAAGPRPKVIVHRGALSRLRQRAPIPPRRLEAPQITLNFETVSCVMTRSALTDALGGVGRGTVPKPCWEGAVIDRLSFPCLVDHESASSSDAGSSGFESFELRAESLHGSVPTASCMDKVRV
jgi:hypothetical protein